MSKAHGMSLSRSSKRIPWASQWLNILGLESFGSLNNIKLNLLVFLQGAISTAGYGRVVRKNIRRSIIGGYETEAFFGVEPFDRTCNHHAIFPWILMLLIKSASVSDALLPAILFLVIIRGNSVGRCEAASGLRTRCIPGPKTLGQILCARVLALLAPKYPPVIPLFIFLGSLPHASVMAVPGLVQIKGGSGLEATEIPLGLLGGAQRIELLTLPAPAFNAPHRHIHALVNNLVDALID